jgi:SAM-dependent methyltransferase
VENPEGADGAAEPVEPDEPQAEIPEGAPVSEKPEAPEQPAKPRKRRKRRARGGIRCPVCGRSGEPDGDAGRARCGTCGVVFYRVRPALGEVAKARDALFSRAFALPNFEERREARALAGEVMRGFFQIRKGKPAALNAFGLHVLEVNCGLGFRLRAFQSYGWAITGTETSATAYEYARRQSLEVTHGWLAEGRFGRTRFDLVLFCASFGEMDDPHGTAKRLRDLMAPGGLVCVLREPLADEGAGEAAGGSRLFLHTAGSLKRAFTRNGFTAVSEEAADGAGTFWFKVKPRRGK